jgi:hypothetical protein
MTLISDNDVDTRRPRARRLPPASGWGRTFGISVVFPCEETDGHPIGLTAAWLPNVGAVPAPLPRGGH